MILPSGRTYGFGYDANGNRTSITMPSGAVHELGYNKINLDNAYVPPNNPAYATSYNLDREWVRTALPSGRVIDGGYDNGSVQCDANSGIIALMTRRQKLIEKARTNPTGVRFQEICLLAEHVGFTKRGGKGSHVVYEKEDVDEILTFQDRKGMAKPYQVKQLLAVIDKYRLGERE